MSKNYLNNHKKKPLKLKKPTKYVSQMTYIYIFTLGYFIK